MNRCINRVMVFIIISFCQFIVSSSLLSQIPAPLPLSAPLTIPLPVVPDPAALPAPLPVVLPDPAALPAPLPVVLPDPAVVAPVVLPAPLPVAVIPAPAAPAAAPVPASAPGQQPAEEKYKKEFNDINESMNRIKAIEEEIKTSFSAFDQKLTQARNTDLAIKEGSFDILKQDTEQKARDLYAKIEGQLKELQEIQKFGQGEFAKTISEKIAEMSTLIAKVNGILQQLQTLVTVTAIAQQAAVAVQTPVPVTPATPAQITAKSNKPEVQTSVVIENEDKSLAARAWQLVTDTIVSGIMSFNRAVDWITSWIKPKEKKKVVMSKTKAAMSFSEIKKKVKELVVASEKLINPMESQYFDLVQKFEEASKGVITLREAIAKRPVLKQFLAQQNHLLKKSPPLWKKSVVQMFSKVIDLGIAIADAVVYGILVVYSYAIEPIFNVFRKDVQKKMQMIEQGK